MGTRARVMAALQRSQKALASALETDTPKEDERLLLEKHLTAIAVGLQEMRSSMVVGDIQLTGMGEDFHLERLKDAGFDLVGQIMPLSHRRLREILKDHHNLAAGLFGLLLSEKTLYRK